MNDDNDVKMVTRMTAIICGTIGVVAICLTVSCSMVGKSAYQQCIANGGNYLQTPVMSGGYPYYSTSCSFNKTQQ